VSKCWKVLAEDEVDGISVVPGRRDFPLVTVWADESVYVLDSRWNEEQEPRVLHSVYDHPVTCVDMSPSRAAPRDQELRMGHERRGKQGAIVLCPQIQVYSLESSQCKLTVGNSAGDFTCVNLTDSHPHLLVCGNKHVYLIYHYTRFNTITLVTASVPDEKIPHEACITDDDLTAGKNTYYMLCCLCYYASTCLFCTFIISLDSEG
ncbi:hypothetical protein cypCar_00006564, partial [Cyprinus carpio]